MNYFNYAIKCIIRNIIYKLMKPRNLVIILVSIIVIFLLSQYTSVFGWEGDNNYTDKNNTIVMQYDSINQDLVNRIKYFSGNSDNIDNLKDYLRNNNYNYYVFYGSPNGSSMISGSYYATNDLYIYFYDRENFTTSGTAYDLYQGMTTNIQIIESALGPAFVFTGNNVSTWTIQSFYIPTVLINYKSNILYDFLNATDEEQTNSIVGAINQQTNTIQQQTNTIQEQTEAMTSTDFDENQVSIDVTATDVDNSAEEGLFTTIFSSFNNSINNTNVEYLEIPLVNNQSLRIPSNIVSSHLGSLTALINAFWYFVFGFYAFKFVNNLLVKIKDGSILDGYTSNEVITSDMM